MLSKQKVLLYGAARETLWIKQEKAFPHGKKHSGGIYLWQGVVVWGGGTLFSENNQTSSNTAHWKE